tara:strand:- start:13252 stop:14706 length:1455 start_codon:yes stop_codon:yes gene_type:complete
MENLIRLVILSFAIFLSGELTAQISFYKTYDGSSFDTGEGVVQLPDSSYAITGGSGAFSINSGQAYIMLTDSTGEHLWTKSFGGNGSEIGRRIFYEDGVGFTVVGTTNSTDDGRYNFYYLRTDELGNLIEEKNFGTSNWEQLWDAVKLPDGGLIMVGESEGEETAMKDIYIARVDDQGDTIWTKTISTGVDDAAKAVDILNDTTVIIGGYRYDGSKSNAALISMHINGTENWTNFYPGTVDNAKINDLSIYDNNIYCAGEITLPGHSDLDWWLWKADDEGNDIDELVGEFDRYDGLSALCVKDDNIYIGLQSDSDFYNTFPIGVDAFVLKFHIDLWYNGLSQSYSGVNSDLFNQMMETIDGGVMMAGTCGQDRVEASLSTSVMAIKIGPGDEVTNVADLGNDLVSIENNDEISDVKIYPNPSSDFLHLEGIKDDFSVQIISNIGETVFEAENSSIIDIRSFSEGVYLLRLTVNDTVSFARIIKR